MLNLRTLLVMIAFIGISSASHAQHSDILVDVVEEQLTVDQSLFLSDFRSGITNDVDVLELSNPGYATQGTNVLQPGALLSFGIVGPLLYSDGTKWRPVETDAYLELFRPRVEGHSVIATGLSTTQMGFPLAQADDRGTLHEHIRFRLGDQEGGPPLVGVYGVQKVLTSPGIASSDPYMLIFNNGLETPDFIQTVVAARQLIADSPFDCTGDGLLTSDDLVCVSDIEQRDNVLRSIDSVAGDLDGNGNVEFSDFLTLSQNFGTDETSYSAGNIDLVDGVAFPDFLELSRNFGFAGREPITSVPEPGAWSLFSVAFACFLGRARFG